MNDGVGNLVGGKYSQLSLLRRYYSFRKDLILNLFTVFIMHNQY